MALRVCARIAIAWVDDVSIPRQGGSHPQCAGAASQELPAPLAISEAMVLMGIKANETWALPERVEALVEALDLPGFGKSQAATQAAAPAPKPAATMPVPASAPSAKALGKQKSLAEEPQRAKCRAWTCREGDQRVLTSSHGLVS